MVITLVISNVEVMRGFQIRAKDFIKGSVSTKINEVINGLSLGWLAIDLTESVNLDKVSL